VVQSSPAYGKSQKHRPEFFLSGFSRHVPCVLQLPSNEHLLLSGSGVELGVEVPVGEDVGDAVAVADAVTDAVPDAVADAVPVPVWVADLVAVAVAVPDAVDVAVTVTDAVLEPVTLAVREPVAVADDELDEVAVSLGVAELVTVAVSEAVPVPDDEGVQEGVMEGEAGMERVTEEEGERVGVLEMEAPGEMEEVGVADGEGMGVPHMSVVVLTGLGTRVRLAGQEPTHVPLPGVQSYAGSAAGFCVFSSRYGMAAEAGEQVVQSWNEPAGPHVLHCDAQSWHRRRPTGHAHWCSDRHCAAHMPAYGPDDASMTSSAGQE